MRGVREKSELAEFNISRRLTARLGALLLKQMEVSPAIIEAAVPGSPLEKLLLRPALLEDLTVETLREEAAKENFKKEGIALTIAESEEGWRIIALEEEFLAEEAWGEEKEPQAKGEAQQTLAKRTEPGVPEAGDLFSEARLKELRVTLVTSADTEAKIEALRLLCYSPLSAEEKTEVLIQGAQDAEGSVRAEVAGLSSVIGVDTGAVENLRTLAAGDEKDRVFAAERLGVYAREGKGAAAVMGVTALVATLRHDGSADIRKACLKSLEDSAGFLASNEHHAAELVRMLLAHLARDYATLSFPARRLLVRIAEFIPSVVRNTLWEEVDATPDRRVRVMLLGVLGDIEGVEVQRLARAMAEEAARPEERGVDFRSFSNYFHKMGVDVVKALVDVYPAADQSQRKYLVHLLDDICRYGEVTPEVKEEVALLFKRYLSGAGRDIRVTIMTAHLVSDHELSNDSRRELAKLFLENIHDVRMLTDIDNVEYTISRIGLPAVEPLVERLSERYPDGERMRAARLIGELGRYEGAAGNSAEVVGVLEELMRRLERQRLDGFPEPGELLLAAGKIASSPAISRDAVDVVARAILEKLEKLGPDAYTYEALGWAASSTKASASFIKKALKALYEMLDRPEAEIASESHIEGDIKVFELGSEAGFYTDLLPAAMKGLELIYLGHRRAQGLRKTVVGFLLRKWQEATTGKRMWGPGNVTEMVHVLRRIAAHSSTDVEVRISVLKMLGKRLYNIPVMLAVGDILKADDSPGGMADIASAVAVALLKLRDTDGRFNEDEREEVLEVLGKIVGRQYINMETPGTKKLRYTLAESLFAGLRDGVPGTYDALAPLRLTDWIPEDLKQSIKERLADYESIVPYAPL